MRGVPHLKELFTKYNARGFELVAVSNETEDKIAGFVNGDKKPNYTVVRYSKIAEQYGVKGWPSAWVLDANGKVLWADHFIDKVSDEQWEKWLENLAPTRVDKTLAKELGGAVKAFDKGEVGKALEESRKVAETATDGAVKADCEYLQGLCDKHVKLHTRKIESAGSDTVARVKALEDGAAKLKGSEIGNKWDTEAKELKKSKEYKDCSAAAEELAKLKPQLKDMKESNAKKKLEAIAKKYPDTPAGKEAAELAKGYN
ncbi:MAG: redoxin domain-containing protein [Planctomycetes bacterium]|jgi:predicted RNA-binding protein with PIN domain|nr:redoxin domain-containing protein [Planctomycetota bacterium]MCL4730397.1 redoxin domain-containing protein [Planctomycetota bacterium]